MTCKEKLKQEHPKNFIDIIEYECPHHYGYAFRPSFCEPSASASADPAKCDKCWDREIKEVEYNDNFNTLEYKPQKSEPLFKVNEVKEENGGLTVNMTPIIKDSGDRTEFESGAVRDMREGKGRCDLMPLEVVSRWLRDDVLRCIAQYMVQSNIEFLYDALTYFVATAYPNMHTSKIEACLEVAKHFEDGAKKYGENNWQKGIPTYCYIDSAIRHYLKWYRGDKDEPHDRAFVWNLMCCIWEVDYHKDKGE